MAWFSLLPNARTDLAAFAENPASGETRRRVTYGVEIRSGGSAIAGQPRIELRTDVLGAGDVVGIDPAMIITVEPPAGVSGFEPNYMPFVEFADADFPWRYSFQSGAGTRVTPWLVLLALRSDEFEPLDRGNSPLPRVRILDPGTSLPDLAQSWAFAHVHVAHGDQRSTDLPRLIGQHPELHLSRLLCPRKLAPTTQYTLLLVPATEAGRLAGLGRSGDTDPFDKPAWNAATAAGLELPLYHQSRFVTSVLVDFELLARTLTPYPLAGDATAALPTEASAEAPGYYAGYSRPGAKFEVQDALMRADRSVQAVNTDPVLADKLSKTLGAVIAGETVPAGSDGPNAEDPLVAMPPYGWRFRGQRSLDFNDAQAGTVVDRINLDLKFRQVAGLGAETVRRNQEHFSRLCWRQYEEIAATNQRLARLQLAERLTVKAKERRLDRLSPEIVVSLAEPLHDVAHVAGAGLTATVLANAGVPASFASRSLRRVSAKRTIRVLPRGAEVSRMQVPMPRLPGTSTAAAPVGAARRLPAVPALLTNRIDTLFGPGRFTGLPTRTSLAVPVKPVSTAGIARAVGELLTQLPRLKASARITGLTHSETQALAPIMRAPSISDPLVNLLAEFESRALLRAVDTVPNNSVSVLKENRAFVEAFLVGANHEMNNELRWREFPTDMRGTIFARFWDRKRRPGDPTGDDIPPIHGWSRALGANYPLHDRDRSEALVLLIRGDLIRKFGDILVVLNHATGTQYQHGAGTNSEPVFWGRLGADAAYYGFDVSREAVLADKRKYFFVMYEEPGRVRFGLDIGSATVRRQRFDFTRATLSFPLRNLQRDAAKAVLPSHLRTGNAPPASAATWDQLSWAHVRLGPSGFVDFATTDPNVPELPDYWPTDRTSASVARSFWQKPVAVALAASRVL